jgi:predicted transposase/invertase (TIGR01784 family)
MKSGFGYDKLRQTITVVIVDYVLLPGETGYINTFELRNSKTGTLFTDLQKYVIVELPRLPEKDDGQAIWPQLRFFRCRTKEDLDMLLKKHPEVGPVVTEYQRITWSEKFRLRAEYKEKQRRDARAAREYVRDEGIDEGLKKGRNEVLGLIEQGYTLEQIRATLKEVQSTLCVS